MISHRADYSYLQQSFVAQEITSVSVGVICAWWEFAIVIRCCLSQDIFLSERLLMNANVYSFVCGCYIRQESMDVYVGVTSNGIFDLCVDSLSCKELCLCLMLVGQ